MIVEEEIEVKINQKNFNHYKELGYNIEVGKITIIKNSDLTTGSHIKVRCKCDYCGKEKHVIFKNYIMFTKTNSKYCCNNQNCVNQKIKDICNIKYGVDNPFQDESIKEKIKDTLFNRYGVEHPMYLDKTKEKIKRNCLRKTCQLCGKKFKTEKGLLNHLITHKDITTKEYYDKFYLVPGENICKLEGCENSTRFLGLNRGYYNGFCSYSCSRKSEEVNNKQKETCLERYGSENYRNSKKYKETCLEKYGTENALCMNTVSYNKRNETVKEKYGVYNVFQDENVKDKIRKYHQEKGEWLTETDLYHKYLNYVRFLTRKKRKILLEQWNGYDYYDNEYIKNNLDLNCNHKNYPTIDHKKSVYECFILNMSPEVCSDISNLCITKRCINSSKRHSDMVNFLEKIKKDTQK